MVGRIGWHADGLTYVVPVIYAYDGDGLNVASVEGQKTRMMRENPLACFEVDEYDGAGSWRSAIVHSLYEELDGTDAQRRHLGSDDTRTVCFRIRIRAVTGRAVRG